jgi:hypothetical protein
MVLLAVKKVWHTLYIYIFVTPTPGNAAQNSRALRKHYNENSYAIWYRTERWGGPFLNTYDGDIVTDLWQDFVNDIVENREREQDRDVWNT